MIIIVIYIIRCLVKGDRIMKLKEHLVARELAEIEIRNMIKGGNFASDEEVENQVRLVDELSR